MTPGTGLVYQTHYDSEGRIEIYESPQGDLLYEYDARTGAKIATTSYPAAKTPETLRRRRQSPIWPPPRGRFILTMISVD